VKANESKSLSFAFISFSESGLFNGLPAIQIKKLSASASRYGHVGNAYLTLFFTPPASRAIAGRENMT
jgi:hypothetical protein